MPFCAQCSDTAAMASGQTVMKKPAEYTMAASSTRAQLDGSLVWEAWRKKERDKNIS